MRGMMLVLAISVLAAAVIASPSLAERVMPDEALNVATNWVASVINATGDWGGSKTVEVRSVVEFKRGARTLGYFCHVSPGGYVIVSTDRRLAPVKAYSATSSLDPESDEGLADAIKMSMEGNLNVLEGRSVGQVSDEESHAAVELSGASHVLAWTNLDRDPSAFNAALQAGGVGEEPWVGKLLMLTSDWDQEILYARHCPRGDDCSNCMVGCVATAAAQIMHYWCWPPRGQGEIYADEYAWNLMFDYYRYDRDSTYQYYDERGRLITQERIDAVAELCYEVGEAAGTDYGCEESTAWLGNKPFATDMTEAYSDHFRYSDDADYELRWHHTDEAWWDFITANINDNQPLQYGLFKSQDDGAAAGVAGHSMVLLGWLVAVGERYVYLNYGRGDGHSSNTWYNIDDIPGAIAEGMIRKIKPNASIGEWVDGDISVPSSSFPYRYFGRDATGNEATFEAGQRLQFLPGVTLTCISPSGSIRFLGTSTSPELLFSRGDQSKGVKVMGGHLSLLQGGMIKFR
jgi:hypothetical protein